MRGGYSAARRPLQDLCEALCRWRGARFGAPWPVGNAFNSITQLTISQLFHGEDITVRVRVASKRRPHTIYLWAFDVLVFIGRDLRPQPLVKRQACLQDLLERRGVGIRGTWHHRCQQAASVLFLG